MANEVIIYETPEGVAVVTPSEVYENRLPELATMVVPPGVKWRIAPVSDIPKDRSKRDKWKYKDKGPVEVTP